MKPAYKIWLDHNGKAFGDGPCELLRWVEKTRSLHQAANQMGMSYSKAWSLIRIMEKRLGFPLLERKTGGRGGGGSRVTQGGKIMMKKYLKFRKEVTSAISNIFKRHFDPVPRKRLP